MGEVKFREGDIVFIGDPNSPYRIDFVSAAGADLTWLPPGRDPIKQSGMMPLRDLKLLRRPVREGDRLTRARDGSTVTATWETAQPERSCQLSGEGWFHADGTMIDPPKPVATKRIVKVGDRLIYESSSIGVQRGDVHEVTCVSEYAVKLGTGMSGITVTWAGLHDWAHTDGSRIDVDGTRVAAAQRTESRAVFGGPGKESVGWAVGAGGGGGAGNGRGIDPPSYVPPMYIATCLGVATDDPKPADTGFVTISGRGEWKQVASVMLRFVKKSDGAPCEGEVLLARTIFKTDPAVIAIVTEKSDCRRRVPMGTRQHLQSEGRPMVFQIGVDLGTDRKAYERAMEIAWERDEGGLATAARKRAAEIVAELRKPVEVETTDAIAECNRRRPDFRIATNGDYLRAMWTHKGHPHELSWQRPTWQAMGAAHEALARACLANIRALDDRDGWPASAKVIAPSTTTEWVER